MGRNVTVRRAAVNWSLMFCVFTASCGEPAAAPNENLCGGTDRDPNCRTLVVNGTTRAYLLHVPTSFHAGGSLVLALHGVGDQAAQMAQRSQLDAKADASGFAVVYPNASVAPLTQIHEWNEYFSASFGANPPDDVAFMRELIGALHSELHPDPKRIFVAGLSNGALMTHRVGVELGDLVAAIGVVAGTIATSPGAVAQIPNAAHPVSVLMIHGDQDEFVPCCPFRAAASQDDSFNYWASDRGNGCTSLSTTQAICEGPETPSTLAEKRATSCRGGVQVRFYMLFGGQHVWYNTPLNVSGQKPFNPVLDATTGVTTNDILWNFFTSHPKS